MAGNNKWYVIQWLLKLKTFPTAAGRPEVVQQIVRVAYPDTQSYNRNNAIRIF